MVEVLITVCNIAWSDLMCDKLIAHIWTSTLAIRFIGCSSVYYRVVCSFSVMVGISVPVYVFVCQEAADLQKERLTSVVDAHHHKMEKILQRFAQICVSALKTKADVSI